MRLFVVIIALILFSAAIIACRKDKSVSEPEIEQPQDTIVTDTVYCVNDTIVNNSFDSITSDPYLAAYPGSWWEYSDGTTVTCEQSVYRLISHIAYELPAGHFCKTYTFDTVYVPKLVGPISTGFENAYVHGSSFLYYSGVTDELYFDKQVDSVAVDWYSSECKNPYYFGLCSTIARERIEILDSLVLPNNLTFYNVMHIEQTVKMVNMMHSYDISMGHLYYAHGIGLIQQEEESSICPGYLTRYVEDYYIAPH